ncbi:MAG: LPS export ABC transporter permease LptG [Candidatus Schekmanbacteria bacterium]|nr:LPS export ABC transporter permease LptG [Candidatus Schekmanbacteria bacterium]
MKILDRYVLKEFLRYLFLTLCIFVAIYLIADLFERVDEIIEHKVSLMVAVKYFIYKSPLMFFNVFPFAMLFASLLTVRQFVGNNELIAVCASSVSPYRFFFPVVMCGVFFSVTIFLANEVVLPYTNGVVENLEYEIKGKVNPIYRPSSNKVQEIWYRGAGNTFYNMDMLIKSSEELRKVTIYKIDNDFALKERVDAEKAKYRDGKWTLINGMELKFKKDNWDIKETFTKRPGDIKEKFEDFLKVEKKSESMSFFELQSYLARIKNTGIAPQQYVKYLVDLHSKISVPASAVVMTILGIPFALRSRRFKGAMSGIALSIAIGFSYWIIFYMLISMGHGGKIPAIIAAYGAVAIFGAAGFYLFSDLNRKII